jgi:branched-chain amino acid transport system permease protein
LFYSKRTQLFFQDWRAVWPWAACALVLLALPLAGDRAVDLTGQICIAAVACLSYNLLFGQGGMLGFGHAVYTGLGAYAAIHVLRLAEQPAQAALVPLAGALAGAGSAALLGALAVRRPGLPLAMITLGIGELVYAAALMFPAVFGGEAGLAADRAAGAPPPGSAGLNLGSPVQLYALTAGYALVCALAMYGFTRTPAGRVLQAVRDDPVRAEAVGYSAARVRWLATVTAGFFAGAAGGLAALWFERVTVEALAPERSASYLLFTFVGGAPLFPGPVIGAALMVLTATVLTQWTPAWPLYLGLLFMLMVMWVPDGIAGLLARAAGVVRGGGLGGAAASRLLLAGGSGALALAGAVALIEMLYRLAPGGAQGLTPYPGQPGPWLAAGAALAVGAGGFVWARRGLPRRMDGHEETPPLQTPFAPVDAGADAPCPLAARHWATRRSGSPAPVSG